MVAVIEQDRFIDLLMIRNIMSDQDVVVARKIAQDRQSRLAVTLSRLGMVSDMTIAEVIAQSHGLPLATKQTLQGPHDAFPDINPEWLSRHHMIPLTKVGQRLSLAMADPDDEDALCGILFAAQADTADILVASIGDIEDVLAAGNAMGDQAALAGLADTAVATDDLARLVDNDSEAPIIRLVQRLLSAAVNRRASDVHIEPMARYVSVRYRIDGQLVEIEQLPEPLAMPIASRIKIMAGLDIAESRLPQDGRLRLTVKGRDVDVRVATSPIAHGESIVLRLLGRTDISLDLDRLGLPAVVVDQLKPMLDRPHGMILVTGPTGSGKTTTLYAALNRLRRPEVKILTVEDPVEVLLEGVNQVQVRPDIDLDYPATLRAFLRQDPDILMVGEIRDRETADIAMRAALTGHLVLSTLHTNSAIGAITRLRDIGIEPFLIASTVIASLAQRLVRGLCSHCKRSRPIGTDELEHFYAARLEPPGQLFEPGGCANCGVTGWQGRLAVAELIEVDDALRAAIRTDALVQAGSHVGADAEPLGPQSGSLLYHALQLVAQGETSLAEARRVVSRN